MNSKSITNKILIIDFGSQFTTLIAKSIRALNTYCEVLHYSSLERSFLFDNDIAGVIFSGGPNSVAGTSKLNQLHRTILDKCIASHVPLLGICFGAQLIAKYSNFIVESQSFAEYGQVKIKKTSEHSLLIPFNEDGHINVLMSHSDTILMPPTSVHVIPNEFKVTAVSENGYVAAMENHVKKIFAVQFHPEVHLSEKGDTFFRSFLKICKCENTWTAPCIISSAKKYISDSAGSTTVIAAVSGGVDSTVAAVLAHASIGDSLKCIFVDTGFLRVKEREYTESIFKKLNIKLKTVDASNEFFTSLKGITDPEEKRKIIGKTFISAFQREADIYSDAKFLLQGTLYSDVIESGVEGSAKIKSHHNVGGLPEAMKLKTIEPLRKLFKNEVRKIGESLGIDSTALNRHPFPGPGLAIRILGEVTEKNVELIRKADDIYLSTLREMNLYDEIWQAFCVLIPVKSVGVTGDFRSMGYTCAFRAVTSLDGMTAESFLSDDSITDESKLKFLKAADRAKARILNTLPEIIRVVYDLTAKPPGTIEWQ